jgi:hypothetical protein
MPLSPKKHMLRLQGVALENPSRVASRYKGLAHVGLLFELLRPQVAGPLPSPACDVVAGTLCQQCGRMQVNNKQPPWYANQGSLNQKELRCDRSPACRARPCSTYDTAGARQSERPSRNMHASSMVHDSKLVVALGN